MRRLVLVLSLIFGVLALDQLTKVVARASLSQAVQSYWGDLLRLTHSENAGAFLSVGAGMESSWRFWILTVGVSAFTFFALWIVLKKKDLDRASTIALSLVVAGGIGNLIDRAYKGTVTDFLNVGIGGLRTGIFNVADMAIMGGVAVLLWKTLRGETADR